ncbi:unnamed protein product [Ceratitis capitata]|uniref:(Mediterranean fruit fly) hypothetical protein n=1 Tax=Ceratitis capitata TaxID=7213 RepID=A0A811U4A5_CERCA|nr:unnamed protein product [Ceratitis capitata]
MITFLKASNALAMSVANLVVISMANVNTARPLAKIGRRTARRPNENAKSNVSNTVLVPPLKRPVKTFDFSYISSPLAVRQQ